jgi:group I intron endonuclease
MMVSGIYCIRNIANDKRYIGSSKNIGTRFRVHKSRLRLNKHHSKHLQYAYNLDPSIFQYEILEKIDDITLLEKREQYWVDTYQSYKNDYGYNAVRTVDRTDPMRMRERWAKDGAKARHKVKMLQVNRNPARCQKVADSLRRHFTNPLNKELRLLTCPHRKRVICNETKQIFNSIAEAARILGISVVKIRDSFSGKRKSRGLSFRLVGNNETA